MNKIIKDWENLGYTNVELSEGIFFYMGEIDIGKGSPLYQKIEDVYGCQTDNIGVTICDGYGDDKDGNRTTLIRLEDEDHLFFVGTEEEYDNESKVSHK